MEELRDKLLGEIQKQNDTVIKQFKLLQQSYGFGSGYKDIENERDNSFSKSYKVKGFEKQLNPETGEIENMVIISYPPTICPRNLPKNLAKQLNKHDKRFSLRNKDYQIKGNFVETCDIEEDQDKKSDEEEKEINSNQSEDNNCQWTQTHKLCKILKQISTNKIRLLNHEEFYEIIDEMDPSKVIIVDQQQVKPRGENFLKLKHLSVPGISYIKYDNKYLITFNNLQQLMITFTRLLLDNYQPKLDNQLFELLKRGNAIAQIVKINQVTKGDEPLSSKQIKQQQSKERQSQQLLSEEEENTIKKKLKIQQEQEEADQNISDSLQLNKMDSEKQNFIKEDSSHNMTISKDTAETNLEMVIEKDNKQTKKTQSNSLHQLSKENSSSSKDTEKKDDKKSAISKPKAKRSQISSTEKVDFDTWKIGCGNDYCYQIVKDKKFLNIIEDCQDDFFLKHIKKYKFKSIKDFFQTHQSYYEQIHTAYHNKDISKSSRLKRKYRKKFKICIFQLRLKCIDRDLY